MRRAEEIVKEIVSQYLKNRPTKISLKLDWNAKHSVISVYGDGLSESIEKPEVIDFTSFAQGVIEAYKQAYGNLEVIPISFREEIYKNDKVALDLYPTGSAGIFDIHIKYKENK